MNFNDEDDGDDVGTTLKELDDLDAALYSGKATPKSETKTSSKDLAEQNVPKNDTSDFDDDLDDLFSDEEGESASFRKTEKSSKSPEPDLFSISSSPKSNIPKGSPTKKQASVNIKSVFTLDSSPDESPELDRTNKTPQLDDQALKNNDNSDILKPGKDNSVGSSIFTNESDLPSPSRTNKSKIASLFNPEETQYLDDLGVSELESSKMRTVTKVPEKKSTTPKRERKSNIPKIDDMAFSDEDGDVLDSFIKSTIGQSPKKAQNELMDDLFGSPKKTKKSLPKNIAAIFEDKTGKENVKEDDDMTDFPHSLDGQNESSRRKSVKFENEFQPSLLSTGDKVLPRRRQANAPKKENSLEIKSSSKKKDDNDDDDWLKMLKKNSETESIKSSDTSPKKKADHKNEPNLARRKSSGADWLGLSESPTTSPKAPTHKPLEEDAVSSVTESSTGRISRRGQLPWLSDTPSKRSSISKEMQSSPTKKTAEVSKAPSAVATPERQIVTNENRIEKTGVKEIGPMSNISDIGTSQPVAVSAMPYAPLPQTSSFISPQSYAPLPQTSSFISPQSYAIPSSHVSHSGQMDFLALQTMLNSIQFERDQLLKSVEEMKKKQEEDLKTFQNTLDNQKKSIEETFEHKIKNIATEHESQLKSVKRQLMIHEEERKQLVADNQAKVENTEKDYKQQMEKLKDLHNEAVSLMKRDHEEALHRLRKLKDREIEAITSTETHARSLRALTEQLEARTSEIASLQTKVDEKHQMALQERQAALAAKEKELKTWEGRLRWQTEDGEQERTRLQQLVLRMETRLEQQTREGEEDRWTVQQRKAKLEVQQKYLEEEKKIHLEAVDKEKERLKTFQDSLLREQKNLLMQLAEERQQVMLEKKELDSLARRVKDQESTFNITRMKEESSLATQRHVLEHEENKLRAEREATRQESQQLYIERQTLEREKRQLKDEKEAADIRATMLKRQSQEVEEMTLRAAADKEEAKSHLAIARKIESSHHTRMNEFTRQMQALMEKEKELLQEKEKLADYKQELEEKKNSTLCASCKIAVGLPMTELPSNLHPLQHTQLRNPTYIPAVANIQAHPATIDPSLMVWYVTAQKDREYLQEQVNFLQSVKDFHKNGLE